MHVHQILSVTQTFRLNLIHRCSVRIRGRPAANRQAPLPAMGGKRAPKIPPLPEIPRGGGALRSGDGRATLRARRRHQKGIHAGS